MFNWVYSEVYIEISDLEYFQADQSTTHSTE